MIQTGEIDYELRASLWNVIVAVFGEYPSRWYASAKVVANEVLRVPVDSFHSSESGSQDWLRGRFFATTWWTVYDIIESLVHASDAIFDHDGTQVAREMMDMFNRVLERELSAYRFIGGVLTPITDAVEVAAIEQASARVDPASEHLTNALALLGRRPEPDYRNSIKESISAVESLVNRLADGDGNGVSKAIEKLAAQVEIHPALLEALKKLYGFTSDADGIRHAILEQQTVGYAEASFMLVTCAAFVNFLRQKSH